MFNGPFPSVAELWTGIVDWFGQTVMDWGDPFFRIVPFLPEPIATWSHETGSWLSRKGLMIRDRNEDWMMIDE